MGTFVRRYPAPLGYLAVFGLMSVVYAYALSPDAQRALVGWSSTNLANLPINPIGTLVVSAFIAEQSQGLLMAVAALGLFPMARRFGNLRSVALVATAHVMGTLVSQGVAAWLLTKGDVPPSIKHVSDVGPSYVVACALVATILYGPALWSRLGALAAWLALAPYLFSGLTHLDIAAVGHTVAMLTGAVLGGVLVHRERRRAEGPLPGTVLARLRREHV